MLRRIYTEKYSAFLPSAHLSEIRFMSSSSEQGAKELERKSLTKKIDGRELN